MVDAITRICFDKETPHVLPPWQLNSLSEDWMATTGHVKWSNMTLGRNLGFSCMFLPRVIWPPIQCKESLLPEHAVLWPYFPKHLAVFRSHLLIFHRVIRRDLKDWGNCGRGKCLSPFRKVTISVWAPTEITSTVLECAVMAATYTCSIDLGNWPNRERERVKSHLLSEEKQITQCEFIEII